MKTTGFGRGSYVGDPYNLIRIFSEKEADEILFLDIDATREGRGPNLQLVDDIASLCTAPLCYGGGIRSIEHISEVLRRGVEKVVIGTAARSVTNPYFLEEAVAAFGSSTISVCIDYSHRAVRPRRVQSAAGATASALGAQQSGAGEIILHCADRDGMATGYDTDFLKDLSAQLTTPVVALGGARDASDIEDIFTQTCVSAAASGHGMVYLGPHGAVLPSYPEVDAAIRIL